MYTQEEVDHILCECKKVDEEGTLFSVYMQKKVTSVDAMQVGRRRGHDAQHVYAGGDGSNLGGRTQVGRDCTFLSFHWQEVLGTRWVQSRE